MDITSEGLRIQILDADRQPMFALGGSAPMDKARALLAKVAAIVARILDDIREGPPPAEVEAQAAAIAAGDTDH